MGYRASVQNSEGRPGDPPDLPSSRKPNRSAHLRRLPRLLHADHPDASAPRPRPGTDRAKRARKVRRHPNDRRPRAHDRRPRDRADPLHPTRARAATSDQPAQTHFAVAAAAQDHRRRPGPARLPVVKTFEAKSLIQHAADSGFWPNPRRRARHNDRGRGDDRILSQVWGDELATQLHDRPQTPHDTAPKPPSLWEM